jgi:hypothetical protein
MDRKPVAWLTVVREHMNSPWVTIYYGDDHQAASDAFDKAMDLETFASVQVIELFEPITKDFVAVKLVE